MGQGGGKYIIITKIWNFDAGKVEWSGVVGCQGSICSEKTLIRFSIENNILIQVFLYLSILLFPLLAACLLSSIRPNCILLSFTAYGFRFGKKLLFHSKIKCHLFQKIRSTIWFKILHTMQIYMDSDDKIVGSIWELFLKIVFYS